MGTQLPLLQKGRAPSKFPAHVYCGQTAGWMKQVHGMEVGLSPGDFVLDGDPVLLPQKGAGSPSQFSAHFYCGQAAACIKISLGIELGLGPGDFVLDGDPVPFPQKGAEPPPQFSAHVYCGRGLLCPLFGGGAWSPCNIMWPGPRPSSIPSDILIHAAIWSQQI